MGNRSWRQDSPVGVLEVEVSATGIRTIVLAPPGADVAAGGPPDTSLSPAIDAYFGGHLSALDDLPVDLEGCSPFTSAVLVTLRRVPAGSVTTYGVLARAVGRPGAARAVGRAVGANPVPLVVPCHRVVATDGGLGGYSAGLDRKRWLLAHEGARPGQASVGSGSSTPWRRR
jgi:methylated-DNA-[protein]-cysteine S-methyltransferase